MKVIDTKVVKENDRITNASVTFENEEATDEITNKDLTSKTGEILTRCINDLYHKMVESNAKEGTFTFSGMNKFYGNDLKVTLIRNNMP